MHYDCVTAIEFHTIAMVMDRKFIYNSKFIFLQVRGFVGC